jgi:hypothetical protein
MAVVRSSVWLVPAFLVAVAAYELALALGAWGVGGLPGEGAPVQDEAAFIAFLPIILGALVAPVYANLVPSLATPLALYAPTATAFLATVYYVRPVLPRPPSDATQRLTRAPPGRRS